MQGKEIIAYHIRKSEVFCLRYKFFSCILDKENQGFRLGKKFLSHPWIGDTFHANSVCIGCIGCHVTLSVMLNLKMSTSLFVVMNSTLKSRKSAFCFADFHSVLHKISVCLTNVL